MSEHGIMGYYRYTDIVFELVSFCCRAALVLLLSKALADLLSSASPSAASFIRWPGRLSESQVQLWYTLSELAARVDNSLPSILASSLQLYPVKSMINADALTSPGCPLWKDGQEGIELYIGAFFQRSPQPTRGREANEKGKEVPAHFGCHLHYSLAPDGT